MLQRVAATVRVQELNCRRDERTGDLFVLIGAVRRQPEGIVVNSDRMWPYWEITSLAF